MPTLTEFFCQIVSGMFSRQPVAETTLPSDRDAFSEFLALQSQARLDPQASGTL